MLAIITFNRVFYHAKIDINKTRRKETWNKHFKLNNLKNSQSENSKCSFENKFDIECFYVDKNILIILKSCFEVNVIMTFANLMTNWTNKIVKNLMHDFELNSWHIRHDYKINVNRSVLKLNFSRDRKMFEYVEKLDFAFLYDKNALTMMIIINKLCFVKHVKTLFTRIFQFIKFRSKTKMSNFV